MFIKIIFILAGLLIIFLFVKLFAFMARSFFDIGIGLLKAFLVGIIILAIIGIIIYLYFRFKIQIIDFINIYLKIS